MKYKIYQVKDELRRDFGFLSYYDSIRINGSGSVKPENYDLVYEFDLESTSEVLLDDIYEIFNLHRPEDFTGHSLSVSDVIEVDDGFWYCDAFGWEKLDWDKEPNS